MQFTLYTEKTVAQSIAAIAERLNDRPTASRPALDGWVEKKGRFSIALSTPVLGPLKRKTRLTATVTRESGVTVIRGDVPDGASPRGQVLVVGGLITVALLSFTQGQGVLAVGLLLSALGAYLVLKGDYYNSDRLLVEVERLLKASPKSPKKPATPKKAAKPS